MDRETYEKAYAILRKMKGTVDKAVYLLDVIEAFEAEGWILVKKVGS